MTLGFSAARAASFNESFPSPVNLPLAPKNKNGMRLDEADSCHFIPIVLLMIPMITIAKKNTQRFKVVVGRIADEIKKTILSSHTTRFWQSHADGFSVEAIPALLQSLSKKQNNEGAHGLQFSRLRDNDLS